MEANGEKSGSGSLDLDPTQEHFFKKYLIQRQLSHELHLMSYEDCCGYLGPPFSVKNDQKLANPVPMLRFFFQNYIKKFPFIAMCSLEEQRAFWQDTVQPFVDSLNLKHLSDSIERAENITKRHQVNQKLLSGLVLFFNSVLTSDNDMRYLMSAHEKAGNASRLQKLEKPDKFNERTVTATSQTDILDDFTKLTFINKMSINVIAVRQVGSGEKKSRFNLTSYLNSSPKHHFEFVIQVVEKSESNFKSHFVCHPYHDFKELMKTINKKYPGITTADFPTLPKKLKNDDGYPVESVQNLQINNETGIVLFREKLRLALRGFLMRLLNYPEVINSNEFQLFLNSDSFSQLDSTMKRDFDIRCQNEANMFNTQLEFQRQSAKVMNDFQVQFEDFKKQLIMSPNALTQLFEEFGSVEQVNDLSPMTATFIKWSKLELAALHYQVFLSLDNAAEWLNKCRKFHSIFPYSIVYGILRFTNPMKMLARIIDLLLINFPSLSLSMPFGGKKDLSEASKSTGAKNLLSLMFVMLLDEDLSDYLEEMEQLRKAIPEKYDVFVSRIDKYVVLDNESIEKIKKESLQKDDDLLMTILRTDVLEPHLTSKDKDILDDIYNSYLNYAQMSKGSGIEEAKLYLLVKQYWLVQLRRKDKDVLKELWREPEMTQLIKRFVTIFYSPLMRVLGKADVHILFRKWEKFVDEMLDVLNELSNGGLYFMTSMEIFNRILDVLDKHELFFYSLIHNLYVNDDEHVFRGVAEWIEKFLAALRLKFTDQELVTIDMNQLEALHHTSKEELHSQVNMIVERTIQKRKLYKEYLRKKSELKQSDAGEQDKLNDMWEKENENVFGDSQANDFGLDQDDLDDFNLMQEVENSTEDTAITELDRQLHKKLEELETRTLGSHQALDLYGASFTAQVVKALKRIEESSLI